MVLNLKIFLLGDPPIVVSLLNESNSEAHIVWRAVRFGYSIHSTVKPQKSTINSYNLFFYRFVVIFNIKYHFLKIGHQKATFLTRLSLRV